MNQYFYVGSDGNQKGPVAADNLKAYGVTKDTLVWCNGMTEWTKAAEVEELAVYFTAPGAPLVSTVPPVPVPPATPPTPNMQTTDRCPDNYLAWSIITTLLCCWPFGIPAIINATKVDKLWAQGNKAEALEKSKEAKKWCWVSFGCAIAFWILYVIIICVGVLAESAF